MNGGEDIPLGLQVECFENLAFPVGLHGIKKRSIVHHIANPQNLALRKPFVLQITRTRLGRGEKQVRSMISQYSVNFLRHVPIKRSQSSFHVSDRDMKLYCSQRSRQG